MLPEKCLQTLFYVQMHSQMHTSFSSNILFENVQWNIRVSEQADLQFYNYYCLKCLCALFSIVML